MINELLILPNETENEAIWRIGQAKDNGLEAYWPEIAEVLNKAFRNDETEYYDSSAYRKKYANFKLAFEELFSKQRSTDGNFDDLDIKIREMAKERQKLRDQRREYNKLTVAEARSEHLEDELAKAASKVSESVPFIRNNYVERVNNDTEAVIYFADWHYGQTSDGIFNKYNIEICKDRVTQFVLKAIDKLVLHHPKVLHIVLLGDEANGGIHTGSRVASEELVCNQLMQVSELIAEAVNALADYAPETRVYSTYGNHMRTIQNKEDSIHADNMERIIPWWMKQRFKDRNDVNIVDSEFYEFIKLSVCGYNICCTHGDLDNIKNIGVTVNTIFSRKYGETIDYTVSADKHHLESFDTLGIESMTVPSLCGTDEYANGKRLYSNPGQMIMFFDRECGRDATYNIKLD